MANDMSRPACQGCGGPHPFDTTVPSVRWNAVIRKAGLPDYLCLTCIIAAFVKAGESFTAELVGEEFTFEPIEVLVRGAMATEMGWVIEEGNPACYWTGESSGSHFSSDHLKACRFARREDAERVIQWILHGPDVRVVQHLWSGRRGERGK